MLQILFNFDIQILKELNGIVQKEEEVHFTEQCLRNCQQLKNWLSIARDIVDLLNNRFVRYITFIFSTSS